MKKLLTTEEAVAFLKVSRVTFVMNYRRTIPSHVQNAETGEILKCLPGEKMSKILFDINDLKKVKKRMRGG